MSDYDYLGSLVCFKDLESLGIDTTNFTDDNFLLGTCHAIDDLPLRVPLWQKHNLYAYNFTLTIGSSNKPIVYCDLVGQEEDLTHYTKDFLQNRDIYLEQIKSTFENGPALKDESAENKKRALMEEHLIKPPSRPKYNAKAHKFENGTLQ